MRYKIKFIEGFTTVSKAPEVKLPKFAIVH